MWALHVLATESHGCCYVPFVSAEVGSQSLPPSEPSTEHPPPHTPITTTAEHTVNSVLLLSPHNGHQCFSESNQLINMCKQRQRRDWKRKAPCETSKIKTSPVIFSHSGYMRVLPPQETKTKQSDDVYNMLCVSGIHKGEGTSEASPPGGVSKASICVTSSPLLIPCGGYLSQESSQ